MGQLKPYNGFSGEERNKTIYIQKKAIKEGKLKLKHKCCVCGQEEGLIMLHLENYFKPIDPDEVKEICVECHLKLHARFHKPMDWLRHCLNVREGIKSPVYFSVFDYIKKNPFGKKDSDPVEFTPDPTKWWENLSLEKLDLKNTIYKQDKEDT
jgi:hypothetical protein